MEVHSHAQSPRKKWTHYFWEFLMLFLAVFCGFLAEYQLEHKIEKERGKQYLRSFVEDLKTDTSIFSGLIKKYEEKVAALNNFTSCYAKAKKDPADSCILSLFMHSGFFPDFIYTDRTLQQLKNAGGLRMISAVDADSIIEYDKLLREYQKVESTSYQEIQNGLRNSIYSLNNFGQIAGDLRDSSTAGKMAPKPVFLFSQDKELLNRYFNQLFFYFLGTTANLEDIRKINAKANSLIQYFTKKYHF